MGDPVAVMLVELRLLKVLIFIAVSFVASSKSIRSWVSFDRGGLLFGVWLFGNF